MVLRSKALPQPSQTSLPRSFNRPHKHPSQAAGANFLKIFLDLFLAKLGHTFIILGVIF